jgi:hypothetical protein
MGPIRSGSCTGVYAIARGGDVLAPATRAASWFGELRAIAKDKPAVLAGGRFQNESSGSIPCDRLQDMREMIFHLPLRNAKELRELIRRQSGAGEKSDHTLATGL